MAIRTLLIILLTTLCACDMSKDLNVKSLQGYEFSLTDVQIYCTGGLWVLNEACDIEMTSTHNGNIRCRKESLTPKEI